MLPLATKPLTVGVLSFDTGSINLGCTYSLFHYHTGIQEVVYSTTFRIPKIMNYDVYSPPMAGTRDMLVTEAVFNTVLSVCQHYQPDVVVAEGSYMGRFPRAFASLTVCLNAIERAVYAYDNDVGYYTVEPSAVKARNNVPSGRWKDKEAVRDAVNANPNIIVPFDTALLDEHAIDSIAIGQTYYQITINP